MLPMNINAPTLSLAVSSSSASVEIPEPTNNSTSVIVFNPLSETVFVKSGATSATATTSDFPIPPGASYTLTKNSEHNFLAGITASGSGTIYFTVGSGQ